MNKNTLRAINKRLAAGLTAFSIGENSYFLNSNGCLLHYNKYLGACPIIDGMVSGGELNPEKFF